MLALTRKVGQRFRLDMDGTHVWVEIVEAHGGKVKLTVEAPIRVTILREELVNWEAEGHATGSR